MRNVKNSSNYDKITHLSDVISFRSQLGRNDETTIITTSKSALKKYLYTNKFLKDLHNT